ncbi:HIRAN domain-containing protein [Paenibacillus sp. MMS18-CY102]|uniref:HIRAN domain-containing protein n=1 Tax=Paenibacillus sp. MMS18-CY102 TaxID=2682849 RepID=UPI001365F47C|nr:HIRAN domain-containing protein [Paenibacillus sp. MMS18-CY102]
MATPKKLLLNWKGVYSGTNHLVAVLCKTDDKYTFFYNLSGLNEAKKEGFSPFVGLSDVDRLYESNELFPAFERRIPDKGRAQFKRILLEYDIVNSGDTSWDFLFITGGKLATDSLSFLSPIYYDKSTRLSYVACEVAGWSHTSKFNRLLKLEDELIPNIDLNNRQDVHAIEILDPQHKGTKVGYIPRPYNSFFYSILSNNYFTNINIISTDKDNRPKIFIISRNIPEDMIYQNPLFEYMIQVQDNS